MSVHGSVSNVAIANILWITVLMRWLLKHGNLLHLRTSCKNLRQLGVSQLQLHPSTTEIILSTKLNLCYSSNSQSAILYSNLPKQPSIEPTISQQTFLLVSYCKIKLQISRFCLTNTFIFLLTYYFLSYQKFDVKTYAAF